MMQTNDGRLNVVTGASRSGKTAYVKKQMMKARRVLAYDPEAQWCEVRGFKRVSSMRELLKAIQSKGPGKYAYVPGGDLVKAFGFFCSCALFWGRYHGPCDVVAEEISDVTMPGKALGSWGVLVRRGLKRGINIYAITQRPAESDKTAIGNASTFVVFRASREQDRKYMSRETDIPVEKLATLKQLEYYEKDVLTGGVTRSKLRF